MANLLSKFSHFRYDFNRGLSDVNFNVADKLADLKTPVWCNILSSISCISPVLANFCVKIPKFSLPWQRSLSGVYFNDTVKLPDPENPLCGATSLALSLVLTQF